MKQNQQHNETGVDTVEFVSNANNVDSIPLPTQQDSIEAQSLGVDPIFIMNERKSREIREYRANQEKAKKQIVYKSRVKKDTACVVCPKGERVAFQEIVSSSDTVSPSFIIDYIWLHEKFINPQQSNKNQLVFIETENHIKSNSSLAYKKKEESSFNANSWVFVTLMLLIVLITTARVFFGKYMGGLIQGVFSFYNASKIHREASVSGKKVNFILDLNFFIITSILVVYALKEFNVLVPFQLPNWTLSLLVFAVLLAFSFAKRIIVFIVSSLSETTKQMHELTFNQRIYTRTLGFTMVPLTFIFLYSAEPVAKVTLYIILSLISIIMIMSTVRAFQLFLSKGFSIFYFLLYLCALEITPVLVILKEVITL